jgi:hypothetical protein
VIVTFVESFGLTRDVSCADAVTAAASEKAAATMIVCFIVDDLAAAGETYDVLDIKQPIRNPRAKHR